MAHELLIDESGDASMMYVGNLPWHGLGQQLENPPTAEVAIKAARLAWEVVKTPVFYHLGLGQEGIVPGHFALVPGEGWTQRGERPVFGVVSDQYEVLQNRHAFAFFDPIVKKGLATYETAGSLGKGERVWVLAKMKDQMTLPGDDVVSKYLLLANSHDGKSSVQMRFTPVRVVCSNTLAMALDKGAWVSIEHTQDMERRLADTQALVDDIINSYAGIEKSFRAMIECKLPEDRSEAYFGAVFPEPAPPPAECSAAVIARHDNLRLRAVREREITRRLYLYGRHNTGPYMRRTLWAAYNSVTEYVDQYVHTRRLPQESPGGRLYSTWFGSGSRTKIHAYETAVSMLPPGALGA